DAHVSPVRLQAHPERIEEDHVVGAGVEVTEPPRLVAGPPPEQSQHEAGVFWPALVVVRQERVERGVGLVVGQAAIVTSRPAARRRFGPDSGTHPGPVAARAGYARTARLRRVAALCRKPAIPRMAS